MVATLDPVAKQLVAKGEEHTASALQWLEAEQYRRSMSRQAFFTCIAGWLLISVSCVVSSFAALRMANDLNQLISGKSMSFRYDIDRLDHASDINAPLRLRFIPTALSALTVAWIAGGLIAFFSGAYPGLRSAKSAIDWASTTDGVSRLLAAGFPYSDAFESVSQTIRAKNPRQWLARKSTQLKQGEGAMGLNPWSRGDATVVEAMIDGARNEPETSWRIAADHFDHIAHERLAMLTQLGPMLATVVAGIVVWIGIATTLGWLWYLIYASLGWLGS